MSVPPSSPEVPHFLRVVRALTKVTGTALPLAMMATATVGIASCHDGGAGGLVTHTGGAAATGGYGGHAMGRVTTTGGGFGGHAVGSVPSTGGNGAGGYDGGAVGDMVGDSGSDAH